MQCSGSMASSRESCKEGCKKKGKKHAVEKLGADTGAEGPKPKKRAKTTEAGDEDKSPLD